MPKDANVFLSNIDTSITIQQIDEAFKKFGPIFTSKIQTDQDGHSLGYGYVQFEDSEAARKVLEAFEESGFPIGDKEIRVEKFLSRNDRNNLPSTFNNLYVKNLPANLTNDELKKKIDEVFGKFGTILSSIVVDDKKGKGKFAFICFESTEFAKIAMEELSQQKNPFGVEENLYISIAQKKHEREKEQSQLFYNLNAETNLFMKNLKKNVSVEDLKNAFSQFGEIFSIALRNPREKAQGNIPKELPQTLFAFLNFKDKNSAMEAITKGPRTPSIQALFEEVLQKGKNSVHINLFMPRSVYRAYKEMKKKFQPGMMGMGRGGYPMQFQPDMSNMQFSNMNNMYGNFYYQNPYQQYQQMPMNQMGMGGIPRRGRGTRNPANANQRGGSMGYTMRGHHGGMPSNHRGGQGFRAPMNKQPSVPLSLKEEKNITVKMLKERINEFNELELKDKRNILGEILYPMVVKEVPDTEIAPKVTGMLIDFDVFEINEILEFIEKPEDLADRVKEAVELIENEN